MSKWIPISQMDKNRDRTMFVVIAVLPNYTTDPWAVWYQPENTTEYQNHGFVRWPHKEFAPTHYMELPETPKFMKRENVQIMGLSDGLRKVWNSRKS